MSYEGHRALSGGGVITVLLSVVLFAACGETNTTTPTSGPASTSTTEAPTPTTTQESTTTVAPEAGALAVLGDWGSGSLPQGAVAGAMMRHAESSALDAILTTGDNFYSEDAEFLMEPYGWATGAGVPFWITWGNHDVENAARIEAVQSAFDDPPRWTLHEWGLVDVLILDSNQIGSEDQLEFLETSLRESDDPTIVVFHSPAFSCGSHGPTPEIIDSWLPRFDQDVVLVLNGHEHNYQRFEDEGVAYVVTGGGGQSLTDVTECPVDIPSPVASEMTHHFLVLEQSADSITVAAIDVNGGVLDEFTIPFS